jgi:hypothetical protein
MKKLDRFISGNGDLSTLAARDISESSVALRKRVDLYDGLRDRMTSRSEGPIVNRPGRQAGIDRALKMSAEGVALEQAFLCRTFGAQ